MALLYENSFYFNEDDKQSLADVTFPQDASPLKMPDDKAPLLHDPRRDT